MTATPDSTAVAAAVHRELCGGYRVVETEDGRLEIFVPHAFEDGEQMLFVGRREGEKWILTDDHAADNHLFDTFVEITEHKAGIISGMAANKGVELVEGELRYVVEHGWADAVARMVEATVQISGLHRMDTPSAPRDFYHRVGGVVRTVLSDFEVEADWTHRTIDPEGLYKVDYYAKTDRLPVLVYAGRRTDDCNRAVMVSQRLRMERFQFSPAFLYDENGGVSQDARRRATLAGIQIGSMNGSVEAATSALTRAVTYATNGKQPVRHT